MCSYSQLVITSWLSFYCSYLPIAGVNQLGTADSSREYSSWSHYFSGESEYSYNYNICVNMHESSKVWYHECHYSSCFGLVRPYQYTCSAALSGPAISAVSFSFHSCALVFRPTLNRKETTIPISRGRRRREKRKVDKKSKSYFKA